MTYRKIKLDTADAIATVTLADPATLNAANETAVEAFLAGKIRFPDICRLVGQVTESHSPKLADTLEAVLAADAAARQAVAARIDAI